MGLVDKSRFINVWQTCAHSHGDNHEYAASIYNLLLERYREPQRCYHTRKHIEQCLTQLDKAVDSLDYDPLEIAGAELAIWFHDVVYLPGAKNNEALSAELLIEKAANHIDGEFINKVANAIRETTHRSSPSNHLTELVVDLDLSGMGLSMEKFSSDGEDVRRELAFLSDEDYVNSQIKFFEALMARDSIYHTRYFYQNYESQARRNIQSQLNIYNS